MSTPWSNAGLTTVNALFRQACDERPDRIYLDFSGQTFTYAQVDHEVARIAAGLKALFKATPKGDAMHFIIGQEVYRHLEKIVDKFEDIANEVQGLVIDHA